MRWHSRDLAAWGEGEGGICEQCMQGKQSAPQDKSRGPLLHTCVPYFLVLQLLSSLHDAGGRAFPARRKGREQADLAATQNRARERQFLAPGSWVSAFDPGEPLHEAGGDVGCFRQGELFCVGTYRMVSISSIGKGFQSLKKRKEKKRKEKEGVRGESGRIGTPTTDANPRPTVKRQVLPSDPQSLLIALIEPAFRLEELRVFPVEVFAPVHRVQTPVDELALFDEDGGSAIFAAANR